MSSNLPVFSISEIDDQYVRKNFERMSDFFRQESPFLGFRRFEVSHTSNGTFTLTHNLGVLPTDILVSFQRNGTISIDYLNTDSDIIQYTVAGITAGTTFTGRFFAGSYQESP